MSRVYVASKYEEYIRVREIQRLLQDARHTITYDWTVNEQVDSTQAQADLDGVRTADALVLVAEKDLAYCGALVEVGIALGLGIPIYVTGHALDERCIFFRLGEIRRDFDSLLRS